MFPEDNVDPVNLHGRLRAKPLMSAVQGICFTLGIELMLASDIVVAASGCRFAQIEVKRGIMPSAGETIRMTERAGLGDALRYLLTGEEFNAETALRLGFVQEVVAPGSERQRAIEIATLISNKALRRITGASRADLEPTTTIPRHYVDAGPGPRSRARIRAEGVEPHSQGRK